MNFRLSVITAESRWLKIARRWICFRNFPFLGKTAPCGKIFKILFRKFHRDTDRRCFFLQILWILVDGKSVKLCVAYLTKNFTWLSSYRYCADRAWNLPGPAPDNVLRVLQILSKLVHFRMSYSRTHEHRQTRRKVNPNIRLKPSFEPINYVTVTLGIQSRSIIGTLLRLLTKMWLQERIACCYQQL